MRILPNRIFNNVKNHLIYTLVLVVIVIVGLPIFQTLFNVLWKGNIVLSTIAVFLLIGVYYAVPERNRLDKDSEQMRTFRHNTPDGSYTWQKDAKTIFRSAEFFSDCISILCMVLAAILIIVAMIMFRVIMPPVLLTIYENPTILLFIPPAAVILTLVYGAFHLIFTVQIHSDWDATRLHLANEQKMEYEEKKK
ncbi:MAG: hypothetical protein J6I50_08165 [Clostridia bacterium]|nr:hypothetical protein [Clostridia bacterium]